MTARKTLRELRAQHDNLPSPALPNRPDWSSSDDRDGLERWKRYLAYEESNPLEIDDAQAVHQRIGFAYRKALANLRFYPEIWCVTSLPPFFSCSSSLTFPRVSCRYLSASFHLRVGLLDDGNKLLRDGMTANPSSLLLAYTLADLQEGKQDLASCYSIYDSLIEHLYARITQLEATVEAEIVEAVAEKEAKKEEEEKVEGADAAEEEDTVETREKKALEIEEVKKEVREKRQPEIDSVKRAAANVWITEMRFARRSDVRFFPLLLLFSLVTDPPST
jgi:cleavage stimulation factor subunit 3